jgi:ABC-type sugar transport system ATPase subunit
VLLHPPLSWFGFLDKKAMRRRAHEEMRRLKIGIKSVDQEVLSLSGGQRQAVAVARAIAWGTRIVIMDEPTAALGVRESSMVLELIKEVRSQGIAVIMVSHNLPEVFAVADRITVLRNGRTIVSLATSETSLEEIVGMMTGAVTAAA